EHVRVTTRAADVNGCRAVGTPNALPPQASTGEIMRSLRNQAVGAGGNVVYLDADRPPYRGTIYRCDPGSLRQRGR
ncbi:MAG: hypothetical protein ACREUG_06380, partial [Steroidobacteraceae bacterium]